MTERSPIELTNKLHPFLKPNSQLETIILSPNGNGYSLVDYDSTVDGKSMNAWVREHENCPIDLNGIPPVFDARNANDARWWLLLIGIAKTLRDPNITQKLDVIRAASDAEFEQVWESQFDEETLKHLAMEQYRYLQQVLDESICEHFDLAYAGSDIGLIRIREEMADKIRDQLIALL